MLYDETGALQELIKRDDFRPPDVAAKELK